ncbi:hypothetical protein O3P69_007019 [Scylla paramamosain]|uniref:Uncharacterized protein n=1 Tax=Scylla paramamosain TaxID=85552 RepID=A0AAW0V0Z1_SCYPA
MWQTPGDLINVCVKPSLRNACVAAALCLAGVHVCSFLGAGLADRPPQRGVVRMQGVSCRALFTVTDVPQRYAPNASLFIHNRYGYVSADKMSVDWRARQHPDTCGGNDVAGAVQQLLLKRDSPSGAATTDYSPLAAVLPSVLAFQGEGEASAPTVTATTRIGAAGGLLPYVPCEIATYADPASVAACFRARLAHQDTLWIFFMGDSKVRFLFYEFLARSDDELHYLVKLPNGSVPFAALDTQHKKLKVEMEASSTTLSRLRVSFHFRTFGILSGFMKNRSREVQQLMKWASGQETPPHMLVLGYMSWSMVLMKAVYPQDSLVFLMDMHEKVAPLLQQLSHLLIWRTAFQISRKTRVIVTSQSRVKTHDILGKQYYYTLPFGDPSNDWGEAVFLHHLRRHSQHKSPPNSLPEATQGTSGPRTASGRSRPRDHLVPDMEDSGVWWWDTSLPLSLAENRECEELYLRGLTSHPVYNSSFHRCYDDNHAGTVTLGDQVTMLLNLACNSVLGAREGVCCS